MTARLPLFAAAIAAVALMAPVGATARAPAPFTGGAHAFGEASLDDDAGLTVESGTLLGRELEIRGTLPELRGGKVRIERRELDDDVWTPVAAAAVGADGSFVAVWESDDVGRHALRAVPDGGVAATAPPGEAPTATTTVYRRARATWYGPGFWGRMTACGIRLTKRTIGIAHKRLPCGTRVSVLHDGRQIDLPVIDRGPFAKGMALDLTQAAARSIGMLHTTDVGWLRLPEQAG